MPKTILLIEDDADLLKGLQLRLKASGFKVVSAEDAIGAITVLKQSNPDLAIVDLGLPGGDGYTVIRRIHGLGHVIPIIVVSARDPAVAEEKSLDAGAVAYFRKPVNSEELLQTVCDFLGEPY